jgi:hypothetical protein
MKPDLTFRGNGRGGEGAFMMMRCLRPLVRWGAAQLINEGSHGEAVEGRRALQQVARLLSSVSGSIRPSSGPVTCLLHTDVDSVAIWVNGMLA